MAQGRSKRDQSVVHLLHRAGQRADELFTRSAGGLTPRQYEILKAVAGEKGPSQTVIMAVTGIDRSSTAALVRRMVRNGILQRRRTRHDSRAYAVRLTPRGEELLAAAEPLALAADRDLMVALTSPQRRQFIEALHRVVGLP
jgi:MarR family transcriptional regulator, temperature-dependent positive regulator of motility